MKTNIIIPILAALTLAAACTKTIEFSGKETASLPVLISQAEADNTLYDLNGRRVVRPTKGIYVTGSGKKVYIK